MAEWKMSSSNPFDEPGYGNLPNKELSADIAGILAIAGGMIGLHEFYRGRHKVAYIRFLINFTGIGLIVNCIWTSMDIHSIGTGSWDPRLPAAEWILYPLKVLKLFVIILAAVAILWGGITLISSQMKKSADASNDKVLAMLSQLNDYVNKQRAYFGDYHELGSWQSIEYRPHAEGFVFAEHPKYYSAVAQVKKNMGGCPKGSQFYVFAYTENTGWKKKVSFDCKVESKDEAACMGIISAAGGFPSMCEH